MKNLSAKASLFVSSMASLTLVPAASAAVKCDSPDSVTRGFFDIAWRFMPGKEIRTEAQLLVAIEACKKECPNLPWKEITEYAIELHRKDSNHGCTTGSAGCYYGGAVREFVPVAAKSIECKDKVDVAGCLRK